MKTTSRSEVVLDETASARVDRYTREAVTRAEIQAHSGTAKVEA